MGCFADSLTVQVGQMVPVEFLVFADSLFLNEMIYGRIKRQNQTIDVATTSLIITCFVFVHAAFGHNGIFLPVQTPQIRMNAVKRCGCQINGTRILDNRYLIYRIRRIIREIRASVGVCLAVERYTFSVAQREHHLFLRLRHCLGHMQDVRTVATMLNRLVYPLIVACLCDSQTAPFKRLTRFNAAELFFLERRVGVHNVLVHTVLHRIGHNDRVI